MTAQLHPQLQTTLYRILNDAATEFELACNKYLVAHHGDRCEDHRIVHLTEMKRAVDNAATCFTFLQIKKAKPYCDLIALVLAKGSEQGLPGFEKIIAEISIILFTCAKLYSCAAEHGHAAVDQLMNIPALNRLRVFIDRKPLVFAAEDWQPVSAMALLAADKLQSIMRVEMEAAAGLPVDDQDAIMQFALAYWDRESEFRQILEQAKNALCHLLKRKLASMRFADSEGAAVKPAVLHAAYNSTAELLIVAALLSLKQLQELLQLLQRSLWHILRWGGGWQQDSHPESAEWLRPAILQQHVDLLELAIEQEAAGSYADCKTVMQTSAFRRFSTGIYNVLSGIEKPAVDLSTFNSVDAHRLQQLLSSETDTYLQGIEEFLTLCQSDNDCHYVTPDSATVFYKLSLNLKTFAGRAAYEKADSLRVTLSVYMEQQVPVDQALLAALQKFLLFMQASGCLFPDCEQLPEKSVRLDASTEQLLVLEAVTCLHHLQEKTELPDSRSTAKLPLYLATNIRALMAAEHELKTLFALPQTLARRLPALITEIVNELQILVSGAHALKVYRVEALSAVLLELYQQSGYRGHESHVDCELEQHCCDRRWQILLLRAHRGLKRMLNQAAAHQEVSSARTIIAALYHWLESRPLHHENRDQTIYRIEIEELLAAIESAAGSLERYYLNGALDGDMEPASAAAALLRALHTLKGNAGLHNQQALAKACHQAESFFSRFTAQPPAQGEGDEDIPAQINTALQALLQATEPVPQWHIAESAQDMHAYIEEPTLLLSQRDTAIPVAALQRLSALAANSRVSHQRIQRLFSGSSGNIASYPAQLKELLHAQAERLTLLEQQIRVARLVNPRRLFSRFERLVGKVSNELDKQVRFQLQDGGLPLDRALLDYLQPSIEHLLRNAISHGVEPATLRRRYGKPETATVSLRIKTDADSVYLSVCDDGAGIDESALLQRAMTLGIAAAGTMSVDERLQCLLHPGFSTSESVSLHAGRGLGLDVVHKAVSALRGRVELSSVVHEGSCFSLVVPRLLLG